ncbi:unnamed protein product [Ixodes hexagonus]
MQTLQELVGLEDYQLTQEHGRVVLKPLRPWPTPDTLPRGTTCDKDGSLLWLDQEVLVRCRAFFTSIQYRAAIFAGCPSLKPSGSFSMAVADVAAKTATVVVVHNRDSMDVLLQVFPKATVLYLLHDLCLHEESAALADGPKHPLWELHGNCAAMGTEQLVMTQGRVLQMGLRCPQMTLANASLPDLTRAEEDQFVWGGLVHEWKALVLGHYYRGRQGFAESYSEPSVPCMTMVELMCPYLEHLTVNTSSPEVLLKATTFNLKSLSLTFVPGLYSFGACVMGLCHSRHLEALSLCHFEGVSLTFIAATFHSLRRLSLRHCSLSDSNLHVGSFCELRELEVGDMPRLALRFLLHGCPNLSSLTLNEPDACVTFLDPSLSKSQMRKLKVLKLRLLTPLRQCGLHVDDLHRLTKELPTLRHVATDNLDIRLYVQKHAAHVTLGWYDCTTCAAQFPQLSKRHANMWQKVHSKPAHPAC